jgi:ribosomal protein S18 acetylase RimI-like enzyme
MIETVLDVARKNGYEQAELEVAVPNEKAVALYKSLGFEICGTFPHGVKYKDDSYADYYTMIKKLV